ncbi:MAG: GAD-like domain [Sphingomonadales bacterium]|jgi:hypothetical protein|nr:GAD-like domain [Sphingomonadales bacterium]
MPPYQPFSEHDGSAVGDRIPIPMRAILKETGWCAFDEQAFWLADPVTWERAGKGWLPAHASRCDVLLRSAFGEMIIWGGDFFWLVLPRSRVRIRQTASADWLFGSTLQQPEFTFNSDVPNELKTAKASGILDAHEIYLARNDDGDSKAWARVDGVDALEQLAERGPISAVEQ